MPNLVDSRLTAETFPPEQLVETVVAVDGEICVVVPVRTTTRDWGLLAVVGAIDSTSARETYQHWAALLCASLESQRLQEEVRRSALYDSLTGLPNRRLFLEKLKAAIALRGRSGAQFGVLFLDLDGFKLINDSLGHQMGDRVLTAVGDRIGAELRAVDTGARFGGDEFAILLHDTDARRCAGRRPPRAGRAGTPPRPRRVRRLDQGQHGHRDQHRRVRVRRGHPARRRHRHVPREDRRTGNRSRSSTRRCARTPCGGRLLHTEIRLALEEHQFEVFYQPIVNLASGRTDRFEALVRWRHPDRGLVMPDDFLPVMEETGLIVGLGHWILEEVCRQLAEWGPRVVSVSINISDREFWHRGLLPHILGRAFAATASPPTDSRSRSPKAC